MKSKFFQCTALLLGSLLLASCKTPIVGPHGIIRDPNGSVVEAYSLPKLKTPPGLAPIHDEPYYAIPGASETILASPVPLLPPGSALEARSRIKMQDPVPLK